MKLRLNLSTRISPAGRAMRLDDMFVKVCTQLREDVDQLFRHAFSCCRKAPTFKAATATMKKAARPATRIRSGALPRPPPPPGPPVCRRPDNCPLAPTTAINARKTAWLTIVSHQIAKRCTVVNDNNYYIHEHV